MQDTQAFEPFYKISNQQGNQTGTLVDSVTVACTASGAVASGVLPPSNGGGTSLQIANKTGGWAHVNFGIFGSVTAATVAASYPVAPGAVVVVTVEQEVTGASVILDSSTGNVILTRGNGT